jgi:hypothetical protein
MRSRFRGCASAAEGRARRGNGTGSGLRSQLTRTTRGVRPGRADHRALIGCHLHAARARQRGRSWLIGDEYANPRGRSARNPIGCHAHVRARALRVVPRVVHGAHPADGSGQLVNRNVRPRSRGRRAWPTLTAEPPRPAIACAERRDRERRSHARRSSPATPTRSPRCSPSVETLTTPPEFANRQGAPASELLLSVPDLSSDTSRSQRAHRSDCSGTRRVARNGART